MGEAGGRRRKREGEEKGRQGDAEERKEKDEVRKKRGRNEEKEGHVLSRDNVPLPSSVPCLPRQRLKASGH